MRNNTKKLTTMAIMVSFALILSFIESRIPAFVAIPGVKVGLANIAVIFTLYKMGIKEAAAISVVRILLVSMLFGNPVSLVYSLAGCPSPDLPDSGIKPMLLMSPALACMFFTSSATYGKPIKKMICLIKFSIFG